MPAGFRSDGRRGRISAVGDGGRVRYRGWPPGQSQRMGGGEVPNLKPGHHLYVEPRTGGSSEGVPVQGEQGAVNGTSVTFSPAKPMANDCWRTSALQCATQRFLGLEGGLHGQPRWGLDPSLHGGGGDPTPPTSKLKEDRKIFAFVDGNKAGYPSKKSKKTCDMLYPPKSATLNNP